MSVKQRLTDYIKYRKISKSEFCRTIEVSNAYITSIVTSIQPDKIERITLKYPDLNTGWLLTGEGEMLKNDETSKNNIKEKAVLIHQSDPKDLEIIQLQRQMISDRDKIIKLMEKRIEMLEQNQVCFYPKYEDNPSSMELNDVHVEYRASKP